MAYRFFRLAKTIEDFLDRKAFFIVVSACLIVFFLRLAIINSYGAPPGSDPGNWLAFSLQLFGDRIKAAAEAYPPLIPLFVRILNMLFPPIVSVSILGVGFSVAICPIFYVITKSTISWFWAAMFSIGTLFLGYSIETWAWGGYPQLAAQSFFLLGLYFSVRWFLEGRRNNLWLAVASSALAAGASLIAVPFIAIGIPLTGLVMARHTHLSFTSTIKKIAVLGFLILGASLIFLPWYLETAKLSAGTILNPVGYSLGTVNQAFEYVFRDWPWIFSKTVFLWPLSILLLAYCMIRKHERPLLPSITIALILSSLGIFFVTFEQRSLAIFQIGLFAGTALLAYDLFRAFKIQAFSVPLRILVFGISLVIVASVVKFGNERSFVAYSWYQVVNKPVLEALDYMKQEGEAGIIVANGNIRGHNYSWWIEGYSGLPSFTATDPKWLNFAEELRQGKIARQLLSSKPQDIATLVAENNIRYIFIDKETFSDINKFLNADFVTVFDNNKITILKRGLSLTKPAPGWWPSDGISIETVSSLIPPRPSVGLTETEAGYYREWYMVSRKRYISVAGSIQPVTGADDAFLYRYVNTLTVEALWDEVLDYRSAEESGVLDDVAYPGYQYKLWQAFDKPGRWPPVFSAVEALKVTPPMPPRWVYTPITEEWYIFNRAKLAVVYYGVEDPDPEKHQAWANKYDDLDLYTEIMDMRAAFNSGVIGSQDAPFKAFQEWKIKTQDSLGAR